VAGNGPRHPWYIAIEGAIGVGKTTLARLLREQLDSGLLLEAFEENPFLSDFYKARAQYAFQTQMFFLLSRYRQQRQEVPQLLANGPLIADYLFAKDRLFARLNLAGDEWNLYQQIQQVLSENTVAPDLIVYLEADTDTLLGRIAQRDRPYERDMDRDYIEALRLSYDRFFATPQEAPVLVVDTNDLNFVTRPADFQHIAGRVRAAIEAGAYQKALPQMAGPARGEEIETAATLADFQRFHVELDRSKGFITDLYFNYLCLSEEVGELASELAELWRVELRETGGGNDREQAREAALAARQPRLEEELADCMAYLLKIANYAGIDLDTAYRAKMKTNQDRAWSR